MNDSLEPDDDRAPQSVRFAAWTLALFLLDIGLIGVGVELGGPGSSGGEAAWALLLLALLVQFGLSVATIVAAAEERNRGMIAGGVGGILVGGATLLVGFALLAFQIRWSSDSRPSSSSESPRGGGAWGRPLRIRGRQRHPSLTRGADWTAGPRPRADDLDAATRAALEALWLHDAQKEHASVPAFARVAWLLAAVGAPAELMCWAHRAGVEEIEHAQACFALAAGYGGRTFTVAPMHDLLRGGLDSRVDPRVLLATESLADGCQLEDFNADVAARCAEVCREPVTRAVLERIAVEERAHAELSWAIVAWLLATSPAVVARPLATAAARLERYPRPTAVAAAARPLVAAAEPHALRAHGRLPDAAWADAWTARLAATRARLARLLAGEAGAAREATEASRAAA